MAVLEAKLRDDFESWLLLVRSIVTKNCPREGEEVLMKEHRKGGGGGPHVTFMGKRFLFHLSAGCMIIFNRP